MTVIEDMDLVGQLTIQGNIPCAFCGMGDKCETCGMRSSLFPPGTSVCDVQYTKVEDQKEVWEEAGQIGHLIGERLP